MKLKDPPYRLTAHGLSYSSPYDSVYEWLHTLTTHTSFNRTKHKDGNDWYIFPFWKVIATGNNRTSLTPAEIKEMELLINRQLDNDNADARRVVIAVDKERTAERGLMQLKFMYIDTKRIGGRTGLLNI